MSRVSGPPTQPDTTSVLVVSADRGGQSALPIRLVCITSLMLILVACVPGRPGRMVEADVVGLVSSVDSPVGAQPTVEFEDGRMIVVPQSSVALNGSGYSAGDLFLYGEDFGRTWYARLVPDELSPVDGCYGIAGVAYDEPDAVILVSGEWRGVGLRLPKRDDFQVPANVVDSQGVYRMGTEYPEGRFCVDISGSVFSLPSP